MSEKSRAAEARVLSYYPNVRKTVVESPMFSAWLATLTSVDVDGETLYLRGGDMLRDRDQVIFEWARRNGLLTDAEIAHALQQGD